MRAGMQGLLHLLRDEPGPACASESEWLDVLALAEQENLLPWLAARLRSIHDQLPPSVSRQAAEHRRQAQREAFVWSAALRHMLSAFHARGIPVVALKGPWLADRLHGDASLRSCSDLDFLVRPSDWNSVERMLSELGFSPCDRGDDRHRRWRGGDICVEPHYRLENPLDFDIDTESLWNRARLSEFRGIPAWLLAPSDELMFLCIHAVRHGFERLSLLHDLRFAFRQFPLPGVSAGGPRSSEIECAVALSFMLARRFEGSPSFPAASPVELRISPRLEETANRMWLRCLRQPAAPLEWRSVHRLYLEMETRDWTRLLRRFRHTRILLTRLIDPDFAFAARFHLRRTWQVWLFRQIRLAVKFVRISQFAPPKSQQPSTLPNSVRAN
jgi:hypothetical protein